MNHLQVATCDSVLKLSGVGFAHARAAIIEDVLTKYSGHRLTAMLDEGCGRGVRLLSSYTVGQCTDPSIFTCRLLNTNTPDAFVCRCIPYEGRV